LATNDDWNLDIANELLPGKQDDSLSLESSTWKLWDPCSGHAQ